MKMTGNKRWMAALGTAVVVAGVATGVAFWMQRDGNQWPELPPEGRLDGSIGTKESRVDAPSAERAADIQRSVKRSGAGLDIPEPKTARAAAGLMTPRAGDASDMATANGGDPYARAEVVAERRGTVGADGSIHNVKVVRTDFKYPLIRVEETVNRNTAMGRESVCTRTEMVADHIVVRLADGMTEKELTALNEKYGAKVLRKLRVPGAGTYLVALPVVGRDRDTTLDAVPGAVTAYAKAVGTVAVAEPDYIVHALDTIPNDPNFNACWGLKNTGQTGGTAGADIRATAAWDVTTGSSNVVVAVIDTGVDYSHPDLAANIWQNPGETGLDIYGQDKRFNGVDDDGNGFIDDWRGWDFLNVDNEPKDDVFHGTHCAGTIGAVGNNGVGVAGVCWRVSIMPLKFLAPNGGVISDAVEATAYATRMGADFSSNSWGGGGYSDAMKTAIDDAGAAGILFVAAAGNSGWNNDQTPTYPSSYDCSNIIAVAATDSRDQCASFSCYGATTVDLGAPGVSVYSTYPTYMTDAMAARGAPTNYARISGTSMATPHVAGACALVKSALPGATGADIKELILGGVDPIPALSGKCVTGGRLNVDKALPSVEPRLSVVKVMVGDSAGNGDGFINPGETVQLTVTLLNKGLTAATGATATLSTTNTQASIPDATAFFGDVAGSWRETTAQDSFSVTIAPGCLTPQTLALRMIVADGQGHSWPVDFTVMIYTSSWLGGAVTLDGAPLAGATIEYSGPLSGSALTGADGRYRYGAVAGIHTLVAKKADYLESMPTVVATPPENTGVNFAFQTAVISGRVTDGKTGTPVQGATVEYSGVLTGVVTTASDGTYSITRVYGRPATLSLVAKKPGVYFDSPARSVMAPPNAPNTDFQMGVPDIAVTPGSLSASAVLGNMATQKLTIANNGFAALKWSAWKQMSQKAGLSAGQLRRQWRPIQPNTCSDLATIGTAYDGESLWLAGMPNRLYRMDPVGGRILGYVDVKVADVNSSWIYAVAWDGENLWGADYHQEKVYMVDRRTGDILKTLEDITSPPTGLEFGDGYLWTVGYYGYKIAKRDPATGIPLQELSWTGPGRLTDVAYFNGALWVGTTVGPKVYKVNPANGAVISSFNVPGPGYVIGLCYAGDGGLWMNCDTGTKGALKQALIDTGEADWLKLSPERGTLSSGSSVEMTVILDGACLPQSGTYTATISIRSDDPDTPVVSIPVTFEVTAGLNSAPRIAAGSPTATPDPAGLSESITFSAVASDPDGDPLTYAWDFDDGTSGTGASTTHAYSSPGNYLAKVTVSDGKGGMAESVVGVRVFDEYCTITIDASPVGGGSISPSPTLRVVKGRTTSFTATANPGYCLEKICIGQGPLWVTTQTNILMRTYTIPEPVWVDMNYTVVYKRLATDPVGSLAVRSWAGDAGVTVSPLGYVTANPGGSQTYRIAPNPGYEIKNVSVIQSPGSLYGANLGAVASHTFTNLMPSVSPGGLSAYINAYSRSASATCADFVSVDDATQGNWKGKYGGEGYRVVGDGVSYPGYATVVTPGAESIWSDPATGNRALQKAGATTERIAACWSDTNSVTIDLDLTDGRMHRVAFYCLDWDGNSRRELMELVDADSGQTIASSSELLYSDRPFDGGRYLVWDIRGHVLARFTRTAGDSAAVSGIFFGETHNAPPTISQQPGDCRVAAGGSARFGVMAAGGGPLQYQWRKNGVDIAGAVGAFYWAPVATTADNGTAFSVVVSNSGGSVTSQVATLTVNAAGSSASFVRADVATQGNWKGKYGADGDNLLGGSVYVLPGQYDQVVVGSAIACPDYAIVGATAAGATEGCVVLSTTDPRALRKAGTATDGFMGFWRSESSFTVNLNLTDGNTHRVAFYSVDWDSTERRQKIEILDAARGEVLDAQTMSESFCGGTYMVWDLRGNVKVKFTRLAGVSTTVSGIFFGEESPVWSPVIVRQPESLTAEWGTIPAFSVMATGTAPLHYQWRKNGADIAGATGASYAPAVAATMSDSGAKFSVVVRNSAGSVVSGDATLTVTAVRPTVLQEPENTEARIGQPATFSVGARGSETLSYQWRKNGTNIVGATDSTFTIPGVVEGDDGARFSVQVSNTAGNATSRDAVLTVNPAAPAILAQPTDMTVEIGESAKFTVSASGAAPLTYQWRKNRLDIAGATKAVYVTPELGLGDHGSKFAVVVSSAEGSVASREAVVWVGEVTREIVASVGEGGTITPSASVRVLYQANQTFSIAPYAGYSIADVKVDGNSIGAAASYKFNNVLANHTIEASFALLTTAPTITEQPVDMTADAGAMARFSVLAIGAAPLSYQWRRNGVNIGGATVFYYAALAGMADNGAQYSVVVCNSVGSVTSRVVTLTVTQDTGVDSFGIPNVWKIQYFGSTNAPNSGALDDADGDATYNLAEYIAGTCPTNAAERFQVSGVGCQEGAFQLSFLTVTGRVYGVTYKSNLFESVWHDLTNGVSGTGGQVDVNDPAGAAQRYYRIKVKMQ